jgi:arylsulfatase
MCGLNAQMMIARTDLLQPDGSHYVKVLCSPIKNSDEWTEEILLRKSDGRPNPIPTLIDGRMHFAYLPGVDPIPETAWPNINNNSHTITAYVDEPGDGVLLAAGGGHGGYALYIKDGIPIYEYNWLGQKHYRVVGSEPLPARKSAIRVEFKYDDNDAAKGGSVTMFLNNRNVAAGKVEMTGLPVSLEETLDIGLDSGSPVSDQYAAPFKFTGVIDRIEVVTETRE